MAVAGSGEIEIFGAEAGDALDDDGAGAEIDSGVTAGDDDVGVTVVQHVVAVGVEVVEGIQIAAVAADLDHVGAVRFRDAVSVIIDEIPPEALALVLAFVAGSTILIVLRNELPDTDRTADVAAFALGASTYGVLLLALGPSG